MTQSQNDETQRIDVWLFRTRLFKSRQLAGEAVRKGRIRLDRTGHVQRVNRASLMVRAGDELTYMRGSSIVKVTIRSMPQRRGPAIEAQSHYELEIRKTHTKV